MSYSCTCTVRYNCNFSLSLQKPIICPFMFFFLFLLHCRRSYGHCYFSGRQGNNYGIMCTVYFFQCMFFSSCCVSAMYFKHILFLLQTRIPSAVYHFADRIHHKLYPNITYYLTSRTPLVLRLLWTCLLHSFMLGNV